jgi:signal transduction histidine kinase/ActR/RegA family two-component response regulator
MLNDAKNKNALSHDISSENPPESISGTQNPNLDKLRQMQIELDLKEKEIQRLKNKFKRINHSDDLNWAFEQLQTFLDQLPLPVYFKNNLLEYSYSNKAFASWSNRSEEDLIGKNNNQIGIGPDFAPLEELEQKVLDTQTPIKNREKALHLEDEDLWISLYIIPMLDKFGASKGIMVYCLDLTERQQFRKELSDAKAKADLGIQSKHAFLSNLSHEIRTPLHGILGSADLLKPFIQETEALDLLANVRDSGSSLLEMLDNMLMLESLEKGTWQVVNEAFLLAELIDEVQLKYEDQARLKLIEFQSFMAQGLPEKLIGDAEKLKTLLSVFISNAIKFTNKGFIHLFVQAEEINGPQIKLKFSVKDTGIGIRPERHSELFTSFSQVDTSSTRIHQGAGIGLAMAQKTITSLGGTIGFESAEFEGSTFWFSLDLLEVNTENNSKNKSLPADLPVLLVEDNKINQKIAFFTLKKLGFEVDIADNGLEAVQRFMGGNYRIVLMDLQMPIMNGFDSTIQIRTLEKSNHLDPSLIIALSANTVREDVEKCFSVGMNEYISKPFSPDKLVEVIRKYINLSSV